MRTFGRWFYGLLFGPPCELGCGTHVYPSDVQWHRDEECTMVRDRQG
jgi:hypothetical protein